MTPKGKQSAGQRRDSSGGTVERRTRGLWPGSRVTGSTAGVMYTGGWNQGNSGPWGQQAPGYILSGDQT